jgi:hypothetical protein
MRVISPPRISVQGWAVWGISVFLALGKNALLARQLARAARLEVYVCGTLTAVTHAVTTCRLCGLHS